MKRRIQVETPTPPEKPDWIIGPLHEEWDLGEQAVRKSRLFGYFPPSLDGYGYDTPGQKARVTALRAWIAYYRELDDAQN